MQPSVSIHTERVALGVLILAPFGKVIGTCTAVGAQRYTLIDTRDQYTVSTLYPFKLKYDSPGCNGNVTEMWSYDGAATPMPKSFNPPPPSVGPHLCLVAAWFRLPQPPQV